MEFEKRLPGWNAPGIEPPLDKVDEGWKKNERPPAEFMNFLHYTTFEALKELQEKALHKEGNEITTIDSKIGDLLDLSWLPEEVRSSLTTVLNEYNQYFDLYGVNICRPPFNVKGDGTDETAIIQSAINYASSKKLPLVCPGGENKIYGINSLIIKTNTVMHGTGMFKLMTEATKGMIFDNVKDIQLTGIKVRVSAANQLAFELKNGTKQVKFNGVQLDALETFSGTLGLSLTNTWINTFVGCEFLMMANAIQFNTEANSNRFLGCSLRTDKEPTSFSSYLIVHNDGHANEFIGGDIENAKAHLEMNGGSLSFKGVYMEVATNMFGIEFKGGNLSLNGSYHLNEMIAISGGEKLSIIGCTWRGSVSNKNSPFVRFVKDVPTKLHISGNLFEELVPEQCMYRTLQYYDVATREWKNKTFNNEIILDDSPVYDSSRLVLTRLLKLSSDVIELPSIIKMNGGRTISWGSAPPTSGYYATGSFLINISPSTGGVSHWNCVVGGNPGIWEAVQTGVLGNIGNTPSYIGQTAIANGIGYLAIGVNSKSDWKQITN